MYLILSKINLHVDIKYRYKIKDNFKLREELLVLKDII